MQNKLKTTVLRYNLITPRTVVLALITRMNPAVGNAANKHFRHYLYDGCTCITVDAFMENLLPYAIFSKGSFGIAPQM